MKPTNDNGAHSFTEGATFETAENINEFLKEEKTMKPQFKREEIYIDLSKLSEGQQRKVITLLPEPEYHNQYQIIELHFILCFTEDKWWVYGTEIKNKTELTYSQFLDMMGESEEVLQVENTGWIEVNDTLPLCVSTGDWDGKQSEIILAETITGKKFLAQCYEGFMDGSAFYDWYQVDEINSNDWLINESVSRWMKIPF